MATRDIGGGPAELALQRQEQNAGRPHGAGDDQHGQEGRAGDDPAIVDVPPGERPGENGREHDVTPGRCRYGASPTIYHDGNHD